MHLEAQSLMELRAALAASLRPVEEEESEGERSPDADKRRRGGRERRKEGRRVEYRCCCCRLSCLHRSLWSHSSLRSRSLFSTMPFSSFHLPPCNSSQRTQQP